MVDLVVKDEPPKSLKRSLFESLDALKGAAVWRKLSIVDPETGEPYAYRVLDDRRFELCATFDTVRKGDFDVFWDHPAGRHCFVIDVLDPP